MVSMPTKIKWLLPLLGVVVILAIVVFGYAGRREHELAARPVVGATYVSVQVSLHISEDGDLLLLQSIGGALRAKGYGAVSIQLVPGETKGEVRYFYAQDREAALRLKSEIELDLKARGYDISLRLAELGHAQGQSVPSGSIDVWLPPLNRSVESKSKDQPQSQISSTVPNPTGEVPSGPIKQQAGEAGTPPREISLRVADSSKFPFAVPVSIEFHPALRKGEGVEIYVGDARAALLKIKEGSLDSWSTRIRLPATSLIRASATGRPAVQKIVTVGSVGDSSTFTLVPTMTSVVELAPHRFEGGALRILLSGYLNNAELLVSTPGFAAEVIGSSYLSKDPFFVFSGSIEGEPLFMSITQ